VLKRLKYGDKYEMDSQMSLKEAVSMIALLGGFISGKSRVPGVNRAIASKQTANSIKKLSIFMSISYCAYQINSA
jgi:hypothetical protein